MLDSTESSNTWLTFAKATQRRNDRPGRLLMTRVAVTTAVNRTGVALSGGPRWPLTWVWWSRLSDRTDDLLITRSQKRRVRAVGGTREMRERVSPARLLFPVA